MRIRRRRNNEVLKAVIELIYRSDISLIRELARIRGLSGYAEMSKVELIEQLIILYDNISQPALESVRHLR